MIETNKINDIMNNDGPTTPEIEAAINECSLEYNIKEEEFDGYKTNVVIYSSEKIDENNVNNNECVDVNDDCIDEDNSQIAKALKDIRAISCQFKRRSAYRKKREKHLQKLQKKEKILRNHLAKKHDNRDHHYRDDDPKIPTNIKKFYNTKHGIGIKYKSILKQIFNKYIGKKSRLVSPKSFNESQLLKESLTLSEFIYLFDKYDINHHLIDPKILTSIFNKYVVYPGKLCDFNSFLNILYHISIEITPNNIKNRNESNQISNLSKLLNYIENKHESKHLKPHNLYTMQYFESLKSKQKKLQMIANNNISKHNISNKKVNNDSFFDVLSPTNPSSPIMNKVNKKNEKNDEKTIINERNNEFIKRGKELRKIVEKNRIKKQKEIELKEKHKKEKERIEKIKLKEKIENEKKRLEEMRKQVEMYKKEKEAKRIEQEKVEKMKNVKRKLTKDEISKLKEKREKEIIECRKKKEEIIDKRKKEKEKIKEKWFKKAKNNKYKDIKSVTKINDNIEKTTEKDTSQVNNENNNDIKENTNEALISKENEKELNENNDVSKDVDEDNDKDLNIEKMDENNDLTYKISKDE